MGDSGVRGPEAGPPMLQRTRMPRRLWTRRVKGTPIAYVSSVERRGAPSICDGIIF